jgi:PAS domain S-box-containing protein
MQNTDSIKRRFATAGEVVCSCADSIFETAREGMLLLDAGLRVQAANPAFYRMFAVAAPETEGRFLWQLGDGQWDVPRLRLLLEDIVPRQTALCDFEIMHDFADVGHKAMLLNARRISRRDSGGPLILLAIEDVTEKRQAQEERRRMHQELEERVRCRTAELETANRELEAFAYSVSHDLRAPLRALDGYARILLDDHAAALPPDVQELAGDIRRNAQKMGQLIDDLLTFSRLSRQALRKRRVVPAALVQDILDDLAQERDARQIDVLVGELPACHADPALLRCVWANLLGNAFKYTRKRDRARVEVGCLNRDGQGVYFVRDNGAGFDMRYAGKLFGVFQRLHKAIDYEGTGVGLAIVHRVVTRHGGRVWAEAAVNQGATFYFTLPPEHHS